MNAQPRALYLLNFISMWECFSYYGMRVLLVLFMVHALHYNDSEAFGLYALYTTLVELGGVVGGIAADRFFGLKRAITLGGFTIVLGHLCLAIPESPLTFYLGLGFIIAGTSLFRSNVAAFLGQFYEENDPRRDAGYVLYYAGINLGGFLATVFCGLVGEVYGWHAGFSLAAFGMLLGNISLIFGRKLLTGKGEAINLPKWKSFLGLLGLITAIIVSSFAIYHYRIVTPMIPIFALGALYYAYRQTKNFTRDQKAGLKRLLIYIGFLIVFFICEEQLGSSLVLFSERHLDRATIFGVIPATSLIMFNPLTILIAGPLLSRLMSKLHIERMVKIIISLCLLGAAFCVLYISCLVANTNEVVPLSYAIFSIVLIALGEILIGPTVFAYASEVAPRNFQGLIMGIMTMGFALANLLSGHLSQVMAVVEESSSLEIYSNGFRMISFSLIGLSLILILINSRKKGVLA